MATQESRAHRLRDLVRGIECFALAHPLAVIFPVALVVLALAVDTYLVVLVPAGWAVIGVVSSVVTREQLPGRAVRPGNEPDLVAVVQRVADRLGYGSPLLVRIVGEPVAGLTLTRVRRVRASVLLIGWPLIRCLSEAQLAAVVAHELAHADHVRRRGARFLLGARADLVESLEARIGFPMSIKSRVLEVTQPAFWADELYADSQAATVVGTAAVRSTLEQTEAIEALWWSVVGKIVDHLGEAGRYPEDLYDVLDLALVDPVARTSAIAAMTWETGLELPGATSHPPSEVRSRSLPDVTAAEEWSARPIEFRESNPVEQWCARTACVDDENEDLQGAQAIGWKPDRPQPRGEQARADLVRAVGGETWQVALTRAIELLVEDPESLGRTFDPEIRKAPARVRAALSEHVACHGVGAVLISGLRDQGWRKASRWTSTVLIDGGGQQTDVRELVERAAKDHDATALRELGTVALGGRS